jgi:hypothetical protein
MTEERRQHERFDLLVQVGLRRAQVNEALGVLNISAGGVLLLNDRNIDVAMGDLVSVLFDVPDLAPTFSVDGKIIRIVDRGANKPALFAAMWTSMDPEASAALGQLLWALSRAR